MPTDLFHQVADATRGEYQVLAELGHAPERGTAYLARAVADGGAAVLMIAPEAESLDVVGALGAAVPATGGCCMSCGGALAAWTEACARCARSMAPPEDHVEAAAVAAEVGSAVELLVAVPHARGGQLYFGRDRGDRRLIAYAARRMADGRVWLDPLWEAEAVRARPVAAHVPAQGVASPPDTTPGGSSSVAPGRRRWVVRIPAGPGQTPGSGGTASASGSDAGHRDGALRPVVPPKL